MAGIKLWAYRRQTIDAEKVIDRSPGYIVQSY